MVLRSMHECMHAARFCSGFFFFCQGKLLLSLLCYEDDFYCALTELLSDLSSRNSIKEIPVAHEGLACGLDAISAFALSGSPSVSSFSSGECGNAILQYCYGFNRLHPWLIYPVYTACINHASMVVKSLLREILNHTGTPKQGSPIIVAPAHGSDSVYTETAKAFYKLC